MKIYAVTAGSYSDYHIVALTTNKERAEHIAKIYGKNRWHDTAEVEEYEDAESVDYKIYWRVTFDNEHNFEKAEFAEGLGVEEINAMEEKMPIIYGTGKYRFTVTADDEEHAKKIAFDLMAEYKERISFFF